jgi:hypothetical protein
VVLSHSPANGEDELASQSLARTRLHMLVPAPTPLARLRDTAAQLGITVVDAADDDGPLLDDNTAAFVACGVCIAVNPGLDEGVREEVFAMALALTYAMSPGAAGHGGDITAAGGFVLISRTREAEPLSALGLLATVIAREHGHETASAAFEYTVPVSVLAGRPGRGGLRGAPAGPQDCRTANGAAEPLACRVRR